jgi:cytoskeletal protein RodZ
MFVCVCVCAALACLCVLAFSLSTGLTQMQPEISNQQSRTQTHTQLATGSLLLALSIVTSAVRLRQSGGRHFGVSVFSARVGLSATTTQQHNKTTSAMSGMRMSERANHQTPTSRTQSAAPDDEATTPDSRTPGTPTTNAEHRCSQPNANNYRLASIRARTQPIITPPELPAHHS